ncbi:MAG: dipeptide/oligopeptide/nickel ABC transporter ATP-binding protein, partial [Clostridia bacterium]
GRVIIHLLEKTSGEIYFNGKEISCVNGDGLKELRGKMQMIFQDPYSSLDPKMTVSDIIGEPLKIFEKNISRNDYEKYIKEAMDTVGLEKRTKYSYPHELDGGRRQRIGIARALILGPEFIVCDEPVSALDVSIQAQVLNLMQDLQKEHGFAYMFITHNLSVVKHISNDIA